MPPARLTDARRSERAPAYGTRTPYLLDTDHGTTRRAKQGWQRATAPPGDGGQTDPPARQTRTGGKDVFDCRRIRDIPTSTRWPGPTAGKGRPDGHSCVKRRARPYCSGKPTPSTVNYG
ncbi:hypothetical protein DIE14_04765 [Burkholderia sp. Bp9017]|nr:hypothetical protein DIE14_04765 [Burkholderia sp. Bp9017]RQZ36368.1 hypothetical protein DIE13_07475 [Burkholderia sp. Bp9016]